MLVVVVVVQYLERHGGGDGVDRNKNKKFLLESKHPSVVEDSNFKNKSTNFEVNGIAGAQKRIRRGADGE